MSDFKIDIAVTIGATAELTQLLTALLTGRDLALKACETRGCTARTPIAANEAAPVKLLEEGPQPADNVETSADNVETSADNVETPTEEEAPEQPAEEETPEQPAEKIYTEVDVRKAMKRARRRIEGEDYKTNTTGELYTQWHHKLTEWFKQTAAAYGSDKPSTLPDSESRRKFIEECDLVHVSGSCLTVPLPY